jgi:hypothetical protein
VEDVKELCTNMALIHCGRVLYAGRPEDALRTLHGTIWQKSVAKSEIPDYEQRYKVISSKLIGGRPLLHVFQHDVPGDGFTAVDRVPDQTLLAGENGDRYEYITAARRRRAACRHGLQEVHTSRRHAVGKRLGAGLGRRSKELRGSRTIRMKPPRPRSIRRWSRAPPGIARPRVGAAHAVSILDGRPVESHNPEFASKLRDIVGLE